MADAVIVSTARTGLAKSWRGGFNMTHGATLGAHAISAAVERAGIDPAEVEDVLLGCALPEGATGGNIARQAALRAGLPVTAGGATVNRFCSSGLQTIAMAAQRVIVDRVPVMVAGGVESISCVQADPQPELLHRRVAEREQARGLLVDAADRRDRRQALQHLARKRRTSTACAASSAPRPRARPAASTPRSCR